MDTSKEQRVKAFSTALQRLAERFRLLVQEKQNLQVNLRQQEQECQRLRNELSILTGKYKALQQASTLNMKKDQGVTSEQGLKETRRMLSELMKEVEQCIELIK